MAADLRLEAVVGRDRVNAAGTRPEASVFAADLGSGNAARRFEIRRIALEAARHLTRKTDAGLVHLAVAVIVGSQKLELALLRRAARRVASGPAVSAVARMTSVAAIARIPG